jgi:hypothetical protein
VDDYFGKHATVANGGNAVKGKIEEAKQAARDLGVSRELSLAKQKLEEAQMWVQQHVNLVLSRES